MIALVLHDAGMEPVGDAFDALSVETVSAVAQPADARHHASQAGDGALWAYVAVASPADFSAPDPVARLVGAGFGLGGLLLPVVLTPGIAIATERAGARMRTRLAALLTEPGAIEPAVERRAFRTISSPTWSGEMRQFGAMLRSGSFASSDGGLDYLAGSARIRVPALVLAGRADQVAPPDRVRALYDALGSPEKRFVVAGLENGFSLDYGHVDYGLADRAEAEVFPLLAEFLEAHAPR